jgi:uncharacterized phage infection (PIP) family protein YhgE
MAQQEQQEQQKQQKQQKQQEKRLSVRNVLIGIALSYPMLVGAFNDTVQLPESVGKVLKMTNTVIEMVQEATQASESAPNDPEKQRAAMVAMSQLQQHFSETINELKQIKDTLPSQGDTVTSNPEQLAEQQAAIDRYIALLEDNVENLKVAQQRIEASRKAAEWLDPQTKKEALKDLAKEASDSALVADSELKNSGFAADSPEIQQFQYNIRRYLFLIYHCLIMCKPDLLDMALDTNEIPLEPLPTSAYLTAFSFIRDQKVPNSMSAEVAAELIAYLNYLIDELPNRNSVQLG